MRSYFFLLLIFTGVSYSQDSLELDPSFPRWLAVENDTAQQTSGIAFIGNDKNNFSHFLLADDTGGLHRLIMKNDSSFDLKPLILSDDVKHKISGFPKKDFEDILYDKYTGRIYLSVEGNDPEVNTVVGIYELELNTRDIFTADTVVSFNKLKIEPEAEFLKYTADNIGFEGIAADENYFYFALEGFSTNTFFSDSTLIYITGKNDLRIRNMVSTKKQGIHTICGLYSDKNYSLYGVDRNQKQLFHLEIMPDLKSGTSSKWNIPSHIPNYNSFDYVVSFESVAVDKDSNIYIIDDPWKRFYIPPGEILSRLDEKTVRNFKSYIPAIYKFKLH